MGTIDRTISHVLVLWTTVVERAGLRGGGESVAQAVHTTEYDTADKYEY